MKRKTIFTFQGIICLIAVLLIAGLSVFSPITITSHPSISSTNILVSIANKSDDKSDEMTAWIENIQNSVLPEKELSEEEADELAKKIAEAYENEKELKQKLTVSVTTYTLACNSKKSLENKNNLSILEQQALDKLNEEIPKLEAELDEMFKGVQVAQTVILSTLPPKGYTVNIPLIDFITNITGSINAVNLYLEYTNYNSTVAEFSEKMLTGSLTASEIETYNKKISEYKDFINNSENYKGVNLSAMNVVAFINTFVSQESIDSNYVKNNFDDDNKYTLMYQAAYTNECVIDAFSYAIVRFIPLVLCAMLYIIYLISMVVYLLIAVIGTLMRLKDPKKMSEKNVKNFENVLLCEVLLFGIAIIPGAKLSLYGILMLIVSFVAASFNAIMARCEKRNKDQNTYLNIRQISGAIGVVLTFAMVMLITSIKPLSLWNTYLIALLKLGIDIKTTTYILSFGLTLLCYIGFMIFATNAKAYLNQTECIVNTGKKKTSAKVVVMLILAEIFTAAVIIASWVVGVPLTLSSVASLLVVILLFTLQIVSSALSKKPNVSILKANELKNCGYSYPDEQPEE